MSNNQKQLPERKFGLITSVAMIVGIVIGSGIFFKTPEIIRLTAGNITMGVLVFALGAFGIIFGGLTISEYTQRDESVGGIISYCEMAWGKTVGYIAGWFQVMFYYPALTAIVTWVGAQYTCALFGLPNLLVNGEFGWEVWAVTFAYLVFFFIFNSISTKTAGKFQVVSMYVKLAALIILGVGGLLFGNPVEAITSANHYAVTSAGLFAGILSVAFSYDGWVISLSVAHEIKDSKRNLPKALVLAPLVITGIYLLYFVGVSTFVGSETILAGTDPLQVISTALFGEMGMKIVLVFVVISILGTINGLTLGYIRLPYSLAVREEIPMHSKLSKIHPKYDIPLVSSAFAFVITLAWLVLHFLSLDGAILYDLTIFEGLAVDSLPIVLTYFFYVLLYMGIMFKDAGNIGFIRKYVFPTLATIGASLIIYGGFTSPKFNVYMIICLVGIVAGLLIRPKKSVK